MSLTLREILDLPTEVKKSDFVVRLAEDVERPEALLDRYAITDDLIHAFDKALSLAGSAMRERRSTAAYVHGSFGSGKSQFMGVLSLLLANHPVPWKQPKLHALYAKHEWVKERKVLRLHFHMIGAKSFEDKVFPAYLDYIAAHHPEAPLPALFADAKLFDGAEALRKSLGDAAFFTQLNAGQPIAAGWGALAAAGVWDASSFDAARRSDVLAERERLAGALARTTWFAGIASSGNWKDFDEGLAVISRHAGSLGYHVVALFLDELVLWLASKASDRAWLNAEAPKIVKLVEAQDANRPVPLVSYVARQRDIIELVGDQIVGADAIALRDALKYWEGRLDVVRLEDRDLPAIVKEKVVRPKSPDAAKALDAAFDGMRRGLGQSWGTLLGESWTEKDFRNLYPFSPALVQALVALSHYLQRERTALKVLMELLVDYLHDFQMGQVVPVGDLWDVLAGGEEPMDGAMRERFGAAKRLYQNELLPVLQSQNGTGIREKCQRLRGDHPVHLGCSGCQELRCRADNRLVKTLLLGALVPEVPVLQTLTATRLVQLNHGTLRAPIPGAEASMALGRLREWAAQVGKLRIDEGADPRVHLELEGIDLKPILDNARSEDKPGMRRRKVNEIVYQEMELLKSSDWATAAVEHHVAWRGTTREGSVHFGNVRDMEDAQFVVRDEHDFRVVIDYPFDDTGHSPADDERRLHAFLESGESQSTVVWLPSFFGERIQRDLGDLVVMDHLLTGNGLKPYVENQRPEDQQRARAELESLRSQKYQRIRRALLAAYGLKRDEGELDPARKAERHFVVLSPGREIRSLAAADLAKGLYAAIDQLLDQLYPRHPDFKEKVTRQRLEKAHRLFTQVVEAEHQRLNLDRADLDLLEAPHKLSLVGLTETTATLRTQRFVEIANRLRADGHDAPTVERVAHLFDEGQAMGLTREVADFAVICFATAQNRLVQDEAGRPVDLVPGKVPPTARVVEVPLPTESAWQHAIDVAGHLFGISLGGKARNPGNLAKLVEQLNERRDSAVKSRAAEISALLEARRKWMAPDAPRMVTAARVDALLADLQRSDRVELVEALAGAKLDGSSATAMGRHIGTAAETARALEDELTFNVFEQLLTHPKPEAQAIAEEVRKALAADALQVPLGMTLRQLGLRAQAVLKAPEPPKGGVGTVVLESGTVDGLEALERERPELAKRLQAAGPSAKLTIEWKIIRERKG